MFNIDTSHYISVFKNESGETIINIRKGTRSVSISKTKKLENFCRIKKNIHFRGILNEKGREEESLFLELIVNGELIWRM